ncbi:MAG TPA: tetratricopeptide repeat protein, partial [Methylomirabilota bacterium]|nr:tetratricopeptide repeat protein [Methylomirabilota bacterium]
MRRSRCRCAGSRLSTGAGRLRLALLPRVALLSLLLVGPAWAGFDDARRAYSRGDYAAAYREWRALAEGGDPAAQFMVGFMHERGQSVVPDLGEAVTWYRRAALQGDLHAQFRLGFLYAYGRGVERDDAQAAEWYTRAAEQGNAAARAALEQLRAEGRA